MPESPKPKRYDLEERTFQFAKETALYCKQLSKNVVNDEYVPQLVRSSASIGANYIEANESLGKKDFLFRQRIARKEAKETAYWLSLIKETNIGPSSDQINGLIQEAVELKKILSAIIEKSQ